MKRHLILIATLILFAAPVEARQDAALPDLAPRQVEITGDLTVAGRVEVSGALRPPVVAAGESTACALAERGQVRYNSLQSYLEFCDGAQWSGTGGLLQQHFVRFDERQTIRSATPQPITGLSVTLTPKEVGSVIEVVAYVSTNANYVSSFGVFRDGLPTVSTNGNPNENNMQFTVFPYTGSISPNHMYMLPLYHYEVVNDRTPRTYQVYGTSAWRGTLYRLIINDRYDSDMRSFSYMTVREISSKVATAHQPE